MLICSANREFDKNGAVVPNLGDAPMVISWGAKLPQHSKPLVRNFN